MSDNAVHNVLSNENREQPEVGESLAELMRLLEEIDENDEATKKNETTISDNNGGLIIL